MRVQLAFKLVAMLILVARMIENQKQNVQDRSVAYQSRGVMTINNATSPEQVGEIIAAISRQMADFAVESRLVVEERLRILKDELLEEIAKPNFRDRTEAFRDPDFQHSVGSAFGGFARKGGDELKKNLINLLLERAKLDRAPRLHMILNEAINVSPKLTLEERAVVVVLLVIKNVKINANKIDPVYVRYESMLSNYVHNLTENVGSFEYLQSLGCVNVNLVADHFPLDENFCKSYQDLFEKKILPMPNLNAAGGNGQIEIPPNKDEVWQEFLANCPSLKQLDGLWMSSYFRHSSLTAIGKAIAHSILSGDDKMDANLEVFVS